VHCHCIGTPGGETAFCDRDPVDVLRNSTDGPASHDADLTCREIHPGRDWSARNLRRCSQQPVPQFAADGFEHKP